MAAAYDNYDYPAYWESREYEHEDEMSAINSFLSQIPEVNKILEIGAGYARLTPAYEFRAKKIIISDPSAKLLKLARENLKGNKKAKFIQCKLENLPRKIRANSVDLVLMVRVLHHIKDLDQALIIIDKLLTKRGYLILEFPNKKHLKAIINEAIRGNITFPIDIFPKDLTKDDPTTLPFKNYHPDIIERKLFLKDFEIIEKRSVSNLRSSFIKRHLPLSTMLSISNFLQKPLANINFGPSMFILARKIR
jgi:ubiquinone/menaquinone biosynthesis C-methylase UbiE